MTASSVGRAFSWATPLFDFVHASGSTSVGPPMFTSLVQLFTRLRAAAAPHHQRLIAGAYALVACSTMLPLWTVEYPAIQDLPQHLAAVRVLFDYGDPQFRFDEYYERTPFSTQYLAYYVIVGVFSKLMPLTIANKLVLSIALVAIPYSLRSLLGSLRLNRGLSLLVLPLIWNAHLILGFLNFIAAIPLALFGLSLAVQQRVAPTRTRAIALAAVGLCAFLLHVVPFALFGLGAAIVGLSANRLSLLRSWLPLVPSAVAAGLWALFSAAGRSTLNAATAGGDTVDAPEPKYQSFGKALSEFPSWVTEILPGQQDDQTLVWWAVLWLLSLALAFPSDAPSPLLSSLRMRIRLLAPVSVAAYFLMPQSYDWIWPINARFALLATVMSITLIPKLTPLRAAPVVIAATLLSVASNRDIHSAFARYQSEVGADFQEALDTIPNGSRVAVLIFDRHSRAVKFAPFLHFGAYNQVYNGGALMFSFADFPQSPFRFTDNRPPRVGPRWEWKPQEVRPDADLRWYEYVLVRGGPGKLKRSQAFAPVFTGERWSVYERED